VCLPIKIFEEEDHMMKDGGLGFRTADIQDGADHGIGVAPVRVVKN